MLPSDCAAPSKARMTAELVSATRAVHGFTIAWPGGVSSNVKAARRMTTKRTAKRRMAPLSPALPVAGDEGLHFFGIGPHHGDALRALLDALETFGTRRVFAEGLDDGLVELGGERGLEADRRRARVLEAERDLQPVGRVRVDHAAVLLLRHADRLQAVGVGAAPAAEARLL